MALETGHWAKNSIFYHIFPMGFCGAPEKNDFNSAPVNRIDKVYEWLDHLKQIHINAVYFGPLCESSEHGYDTADFFHIDRRLGTNGAVARLFHTMKQKGFSIIIDGVFNHVGRDFWAFRQLCENREASVYKDWFSGINFKGISPYHDPFTYDCWEGHFNLVKLNLKNPEVKAHIFQAVKMWFDEFQIDGLRLDVAYTLDTDFLKELRNFCKSLKPDFWLMGEMIHGDYKTWVNEQMCDSGTNYECYKGLYSSHNDINYFEIAYSFNRQFGKEGIYKDLSLYSFADNHDVDRVASKLKRSEYLYPLYILLYTMPGIPSIYYGSEWGIQGIKNSNDSSLRPDLDLNKVRYESANRDLEKTLIRLGEIRKSSRALRFGNYTQLFLNHQQFAFMRSYENECMIAVVNSAPAPATIDILLPFDEGFEFHDLLNNSRYKVQNGKISVPLYRDWGALLSRVN